MAAILPFLEDPESNLGRCAGGCSRGVGFGAVKAPPPAESSIADLTRMHWMRQELARLLAEREFRIGTKDNGQYAIFLDKDIPKDALPWSGSVGEEGHGATLPYSLFSPSNTKMVCPIFDLPAGSQQIAGTCPGATAGQHIVPAEDREKARRAMLPPPGASGSQGSMKIDVASSICSRCYAGKGNYISPYAQAGEMARYWWSRECAKTEQGRREFISTIVKAVLAVVPKRTDRYGIKPVRIHSSGDFFSPAYYEMWLEAVDRVGAEDKSIRFWFPTRVWGLKGYDWSLLGDLKHGNAVLRPSAYHMNDAAPEKLHPSNARGTTAIYHDDNLGMVPALERAADPFSREVFAKNRERIRKESDWAEHFGPVMNGYERARRGFADAFVSDPRYDWACQTYAIGADGNDLSKSCSHARAPDGKIGCRACWTSKNLRIVYTAH